MVRLTAERSGSLCRSLLDVGVSIGAAETLAPDDGQERFF
jgi:hypothetical protein